MRCKFFITFLNYLFMMIMWKSLPHFICILYIRSMIKSFHLNAKALVLHDIDVHKLFPQSWITKSFSRANKSLFPFHLLKFPDMISTFSETQRKEFSLNSLCLWIFPILRRIWWELKKICCAGLQKLSLNFVL